jgi:hypothetical protein
LLLDSRRTFGSRKKGTCSAVLEQEVGAALNVSMPPTTRSRACAFDSKVRWCAGIIESEEDGRHPDPGKASHALEHTLRKRSVGRPPPLRMTRSSQNAIDRSPRILKGRHRLGFAC